MSTCAAIQTRREFIRQRAHERKSSMPHLRVALLGCGNVGRALLAMIAEKADALRAERDLTLAFTGGLTRSAGGWIAPDGVDAATLLAGGWPKGPAPAGAQTFTGDGVTFARAAPADVLVELTALDPKTGQPATNHIHAALESGKSAVTANKGPIAHAYRELRDLAARKGRRLRFESTVMDGTPIFGMVEACLPVTRIASLRGPLNSTGNYILSRMAQGESLENALISAQGLGIAEADPSYDLEGWDASVKATVLANVLMNADLRPADVRRAGLGAEAMRRAQAELAPGRTLKQMVEVARDGDDISARVYLIAPLMDDVLGRLSGMETGLQIQTDTMGELTLIEGEGGPGQTALGVLADLVAIAGTGR
jgi:homoserine dehydrogenase